MRGIIEAMIEVSLWLFKIYPFVWDWLDKKMAANGCAESPYANQLVQSYYFLGILFLYQFVNDMCFNTYSIFSIEESFGYNKQTFLKFLILQTIKLLLNVLGMAAALPLVLWIMMVFDDYMVSILFVAVSLYIVVFFVAYPTFIKPLQTKFTEMKDGPLKERIKKLMEFCKLEYV